MKFYATLNENNICTGISQLSGEVIQNNMIEMPNLDISYMWKKHENGVWSVETFEPVSTAPIDEFTKLKENQDDLANTIDTLLTDIIPGLMA